MMNAAQVVEKWLRGYEKGMYTAHEIVGKFLTLAITFPPAELAVAIPESWLTEIRAGSENPPATPQDVLRIHAGTLLGPDDPTAYAARERQLQDQSFQAVWRWHHYLFPNSGKAPG